MVLVAKPKPHSTIHHQKRNGQHQRHTKHFKDTYWPYLPLLLIVGLGIVVNAAWSNSEAVLGYATDMSATSLWQDTNTQRSADHESNLQLNNQLMQAAQTKANDMAKRNYWSHNTPDGSPPWTFIANAGYKYQKAGENLAYGFDTAGATMTGWMNSTEHRANILNSDYTDVGFGIANAKNYQNNGPQTIVVAMYGESASVTPAIATQKDNDATASFASATQSSNQHISRIQVITNGNAPWSLFAVTALASIATLWFVIRHGLMWRRALVSSEAFIVHHRLLDTVIVSVAVLGFILSHTAGFIN